MGEMDINNFFGISEDTVAKIEEFLFSYKFFICIIVSFLCCYACIYKPFKWSSRKNPKIRYELPSPGKPVTKITDMWYIQDKGHPLA